METRAWAALAVVGVALATGGALWIPGCRTSPEERGEPMPEVVVAEPSEESLEEQAVTPVLMDSEVFEEADYESSEGEPDFSAEQPFDSVQFNDVIGIGGGAGGKYGGSFGGRRTISRAGGATLQFRDPTRGEGYEGLPDNPFRLTMDDALSTFAIDVDSASYSNVRRILTGGALPPAESVRIEELINYFSYDDPRPTGSEPFAVHVELAACPWRPTHRLARVAIRTEAIPAALRPASNLVFLIDVSGSMSSANKLPLLVRSMQLLVDQLAGRDSVSIVVYAGASGLVLEPTSAAWSDRIHSALLDLKAGGSTNGGAGLRLAYQVARDNFIEGGTNRVLLATDGDFNVGVTDKDELVELAREQADAGVFLTVMGFGQGNLQDATLERIADEADGHYVYVDDLAEARKVLVEELGATLVTVAKDVKIQVAFDPAQVAAFRLIGYENRMLEHHEFADDKVDAGEIGAGHGVTALYELVPVGAPLDLPGLDASSWRAPDSAPVGGPMEVRIRYKAPEGGDSRLATFPVRDGGAGVWETSDDFRFSAAVATFGMLLRDSPARGAASLDLVEQLATRGRGADPRGYRARFLELVSRARELMDRDPFADSQPPAAGR